MYYYMEHMKGYDLKRFFPALAWGVSCIIFLLVIFFYAVNMANTVCYVT